MARYLVDTNVLLRMLQPESAQQASAVRAVTTLAERGNLPCVTPQVLVEFWAVSTRPIEANGFAWTCSQAATEI